MRRNVLLVACLLVAAMLSPGTADAGKPERSRRTVRHVDARYDSPAFGSQGQGGGFCLDQTDSSPLEGLGCVVFLAKPTEFFMEVEVVDTLGLPVPGWLQTETEHIRFCGSTAESVPIEPGTESLVWVWSNSGVGADICPGTATRGVVKATFSNRR